MHGAIGIFPVVHLIYVLCEPCTVHNDGIVPVKNECVSRIISTRSSTSTMHVERRQDREREREEGANVHDCQEIGAVKDIFGTLVFGK